MILPSRKKWSELSLPARAVIVAMGLLQIGLLLAALLDIRRRPAREINGPKPLWAALSFVNFIGPLAYFRKGRKQPPQRKLPFDG